MPRLCAFLLLAGVALAALPRRRHWSDCAVYNAPAFEPGPCDCGGYFVFPLSPTVH